MSEYAVTPRTKLKRSPQRGRFDRETIHGILDESFMATVAFSHDGQPAAIPTSYARSGDNIYLHGSSASRLLRAILKGDRVCLTVTILDGLVLARSAFHHSVNFRSVIVYGSGCKVTDPDEKLEALRLLVEHMVPGRWEDVRSPNREELLRTLIVKIPIDEVSAKVRSKGPVDDEEDYGLDCWAGTIPTSLELGSAIDDERLAEGIPLPGYISEVRRPDR
ncbi:MAG: pyridoxamine 5'-phosphate oxidase family protein [bacterium]|nr:pyridoxamine 5'-phosphate oxidase family protein [bacterium]